MAISLPFVLMSCSDEPIGANGNDNGDGGDPPNIEFPITFEEDIPWENFITNFDGGELAVLDNPDPSGINTSDKVARMVKGDGQPWAGSFFQLPESIDFSDGTDFTVSVWAPRERTTMLFKVENDDDSGQFFECSITIEESQEWVDITFSLGDANQSFTYEKLVLIFDLAIVGDGSADFTWYFDNIRQSDGNDGNCGNGSGGGDAPNSPIDFESDGYGGDWTWTVFENGSNPALEIVENPDQSGVNTSANVAKFTALSAGTQWAGFESAVGDLGEFLFTDQNCVITLDVWKDFESSVSIKFDTGAPPNDWGTTVVTATNTETNQWQTLTFNYCEVSSELRNPNPEDGYGGLKRIAVFPDNTDRSQENIIYIDNITFSAE